MTGSFHGIPEIAVDGSVGGVVSGDWGSSFTEICFVSPASMVYIPYAGTYSLKRNGNLIGTRGQIRRR